MPPRTSLRNLLDFKFQIQIYFGAACLLFCLPQASPAAPAATAPASQPASQPALDKLIEDLARIDPKVMAERLNAVRAQIKKLSDESAAMRAKVQANEAELASLTAQVNLLDALIKARDLKSAIKSPAGAPQVPMVVATRPAAPPATPPAGAAMASPPGAAAMAKPPAIPAPAAAPVVNFTDHILPIVNEKCAGCHNPDKARGGLVLVTYNDAMNGGSSGKVIVPGSADSSRLFRLVSHLEEPHMPPMQSKLDDARLDLIKRWIESGAVVDKNAKAMVKAKETSASPQPVAKIDTDIAPMPLDLPKGPIRKSLHPLPASAIAISPLAHLLATAGNEQILYYQAKTRELLGVLEYPEGRVEHLRFSRDGTWLVAAGGQTGQSGTVVVFDVESGKRAGQFDKQYDTVLAAAVSPDNAQVAVGGTNSKVRVFDAYTGKKSYELAGHNDWIQAAEFSPDGLLLATADRAGTLHVWDAETGREIHNLRGHTAGITAISFRADSRVLATTGKDATLRLWNMESGGQIRQWPAHGIASLWVEFAPDGRLATCGADGLTRLWDQDGKKIREFPSQGDWVYRVAFTPDAEEIVAGTFGGTLALFETASGKLIGKLPG